MGEVLRKFENKQDPFNPDNYLSGYINISQGDEYGKLLLTHINGMKSKEQTIYSTPKIHYPFNRRGSFYFKFLEKVSPCYVKIDGTNIISYRYIFRKKEYVTYKTRLSPVLQEGRFGNFFLMWKEMLKKYPNIYEYAVDRDINFSYELFGILNKHLISYPVRLDTRLLFGLKRYSGEIVLPEEFKEGLPIVDKRCDVRPSYFFPDFYQKIRGEIESTNNYISDDEAEGLEGCVIYIQDIDENYKQWKLKPETIFKLHCQGGMNKNDIMATCYNALENVDLEGLTYEFVVGLLKEEFSIRTIISNEYRIKRILGYVKEEIVRRHSVIGVYEKLGLRLEENKNVLMRELSKHFNRGDMRRVYSIILAYENK